MNKEILDISVIAANFNNEPFLDDFFSSILDSSVRPKELIIVDDGSTDKSLDVIGKYLSHPFIRLIRHETNLGFAHALNSGIRAATGKYIARIDPDDIMLPDRLQKQYDFLEQHPDIDLVGGNVIYFNSTSGKDISVSNFPIGHKRILAAYHAGDHGVQHPTIFVRTETLVKYIYNQETYPAEDYNLLATMIRDGCRFANLKEPVNRMRIHAGSISSKISYETIESTFAMRDEIFNMKSTTWRKKQYFRFIINYRRYLLSENPLMRLFYVSKAAFFHPEKAIQRFLSDIPFGIRFSYYLFLLLFFTDEIVRFFVKAPVFVSGGLILLIYHLILIKQSKQFDWKPFAAIAAFLVVATFHLFYSGFHQRNISDLFFILLFFTSYLLYSRYPEALSKKMVLAFFACSLILFIPAFFGVNPRQTHIWIDPNNLESYRKYFQGFFCQPHIGSYFFGFLGLFFGYQYTRSKTIKWLAMMLFCFIISFWTGSRTFLAAAALPTIFLLIIRKKWIIIAALTVIGISVIALIDPLLKLTYDTVFFQYFTFVKTSLNHPENLSRIMIWRSWFGEIGKFNILDWLTGKSFIASIYANQANPVIWAKDAWFHNDFLSILFSYGIVCFALYVAFIIRIYTRYKEAIRTSAFIFIFYFAMVLTAFINGLYYYYPVFLLVLFIEMANRQHVKLRRP